MKFQLNLGKILKRAADYFGEKEIIFYDQQGKSRLTYREFYLLILDFIAFLREKGVKRGSFVGSLAWNDLYHLLLYFAVPLCEAVLHPVNLRYSKEQMLYTLNQARDELIFTEKEYLTLLGEMKEELHFVREIIVFHELNLKQRLNRIDFDKLSEDLPAKLCYTTATTGTPKGVLFSHRDLYLQSMALCMSDGFGISEKDTVLLSVPMFHVNSWGIPYAAALAGANIVLPGSNFKGEFLAKVIYEEKVTLAAGVPTIFQEILKAAARENYDLSCLKKVFVGGAPLTQEIIEGFKKYGVEPTQVYGLSETAPFITSNFMKTSLDKLLPEDKKKRQFKLGLPAPGVEVRVVDREGKEVPHDGKTPGELWLKGPWISKEYYEDPKHTKDAYVDGWFRTFDLVTIDEYGYLEFCDREKDVIKSGGEWISSVAIEKYLLSHPDVKAAAVVGLPHTVWQERPVGFVVLWENAKLSEEALLNYLRSKLLSFWLPDRIIFVKDLPQSSVGKVDKKILRQKYHTLLLNA